MHVPLIIKKQLCLDSVKNILTGRSNKYFGTYMCVCVSLSLTLSLTLSLSHTHTHTHTYTHKISKLRGDFCDDLALVHIGTDSCCIELSDLKDFYQLPNHRIYKLVHVKITFLNLVRFFPNNMLHFASKYGFICPCLYLVKKVVCNMAHLSFTYFMLVL